MIKIRETLTSTLSGEPQNLEIPDQPGHYYSLASYEVMATDAEPAEAEGESLHYNVFIWYATFEFWEGGKEYRDHGYWERRMPNGDKIFHTFNGQSGEIELIGGTGKFENIKGKGLYKGDMKHKGVWQAWYEWEYEIAE